MKTAYGNRPLLIWTLVQFALSFALVIPFSLTPAVWGSLLGFGVVTAWCALSFDKAVPRVCARVLWIAAAVLRWALVAYVVYAVFVFAPEATAGYTAESRADIFATTLVPLLALCAVTLPAQALVAARSKADARRVTLTAAFGAVVAVLLYGYETFAVKAVVLAVDGLGGQLCGVGCAVVAVAILAVAVRGVLAQNGQQKTAPDTSSEAES